MDSPWFQSRALVEYQTLSAGAPAESCQASRRVPRLRSHCLSPVSNPFLCVQTCTILNASFVWPNCYPLNHCREQGMAIFFKVSKSNAIDDITITRGQFPTNWHYLHWQWNVTFSESVLPGYHGLFCSVLRNGPHYMLQVQLRTSSSIFYSLWMANGDLVF